METRYKLVFLPNRFEQILTLEEIREGKAAFDNRKPNHIFESTGLYDNGKEELFDQDMIINTWRNGNQPHKIGWDEEQGVWVGNYDGIKYLIGPEVKNITKCK